MRVLCMLREIQEELGLTKAELERELDMDSRTIDKLIDDSDDEPWRLERDMLHRYYLFANSHGFEPFRVEPHAIWRTFENSEVAIFRGPKKADVPVESHLTKYFERLNCEVHSSTIADGIEEAMKKRNCVIIGSPKGNPASEVALALLWGAEPFNDGEKNRKRIPLAFLGMQREAKDASALLVESTRHGFSISLPETRDQGFLKVDWIPSEKYGPHRGSGQDAAVVVVCSRPMGTQKDVTTIVIAGYTGLSTLVAAQEVTYKKIPDIQNEQNPGQPGFAALRFRYRKRRQSGKSLDGLRISEEGSTKWAPPWQDFFSSPV